jgi:hypothetical protein
MLGLVTVDDVLEVTLPEDWRRKAAGPDLLPGWASRLDGESELS